MRIHFVVFPNARVLLILRIKMGRSCISTSKSFSIISRLGYILDSIFSRFPMKDTKRLLQWIQFTRRKSFTPSVSHICSLHFQPEDYRDYENGLLKKTAVPSILRLRQSASTTCNVPEKITPSAEAPSTMRLRRRGPKPDPLRLAIGPHPLSREFPIPPDVGFAPVLRKNKLVQTGNPSFVSIATAPVQTKRLDLNKEKHLTTRISTLRRQRNRLLQKIAAWPENRKKGTMEVFEFLEDSFQNLPILPLLKNHFSNIKVKPSQRKFSREMKEFSIVLYSHSPKAYKYVENFLNLPKPHQVLNWRRDASQDPNVLMADAELVEMDESVVPVFDDHVYNDYPSHIFPITD